MKNFKFIFCIFFAFSLLFYGCREKGDYQFVIKMKDGSEVKAWSVSSDGGGLTVWPAIGEGRSRSYYYHLSSEQYVQADYVGLKNTNSK